MDLGKRISEDEEKIKNKRNRADQLDKMAALLRSEANEIERLLELARLNH